MYLIITGATMPSVTANPKGSVPLRPAKVNNNPIAIQIQKPTFTIALSPFPIFITLRLVHS